MNQAPENIIHAITNYLQVFPQLGTAGQPSPDQFAALKTAGYEVVINLVPPVSAEMLPQEADIVTHLGMDYVHIPVIWEKPTRQNLDDFFAAMRQHQGRKIFVHCVLNMRVSAFVFLYRVLVLCEPAGAAQMTMARIWEPNPTWQQFINAQLNQG
jgi:protein tyrosine phosphatase (PTP) superfamily phosphohydrolase (DUF442 family)